MTRPRTFVLLLALGLGWPASPSAGDWLVTRDGSRIETDGPWEVKGSQVVFTLPSGQLSALRAADVDLEASAAANRAEAAPPEAPAASPRKAVKVITNETLPPAGAAEDAPDDGALDDDAFDQDPDADPDADEESEATADEDETAGDDEAAGSDNVRVISWSSRDSEDDEGLEIVGTLRNTGDDFAAGIDLTVTVRYEEAEGEELFTTRAFLGASALAPGGSTSFRARLPGIYLLSSDPAFEVGSEGFTVGAPPEPAGQDDDADFPRDPDAEPI